MQLAIEAKSIIINAYQYFVSVLVRVRVRVSHSKLWSKIIVFKLSIEIWFCYIWIRIQLQIRRDARPKFTRPHTSHTFRTDKIQNPIIIFRMSLCIVLQEEWTTEKFLSLFSTTCVIWWKGICQIHIEQWPFNYKIRNENNSLNIFKPRRIESFNKKLVFSSNFRNSDDVTLFYSVWKSFDKYSVFLCLSLSFSLFLYLFL